jgi:hypothetical protein
MALLLKLLNFQHILILILNTEIDELCIIQFQTSCWLWSVPRLPPPNWPWEFSIVITLQLWLYGMLYLMPSIELNDYQLANLFSCANLKPSILRQYNWLMVCEGLSSLFWCVPQNPEDRRMNWEEWRLLGCYAMWLLYEPTFHSVCQLLVMATFLVQRFLTPWWWRH